MVNHVKGEYVTKGEKMKVYLKEAKALAEWFEDFQIEVIPRESNQEADTLNKSPGKRHLYMCTLLKEFTKNSIENAQILTKPFIV